MRYALARKNIGKRILSRLHVCFSIPLPRGVVSLAALSSFKSLKEQPPPPHRKMSSTTTKCLGFKCQSLFNSWIAHAQHKLLRVVGKCGRSIARLAVNIMQMRYACYLLTNCCPCFSKLLEFVRPLNTVLFCGQKILKVQLFTDFLCKIVRNSLTWIFIKCV